MNLEAVYPSDSDQHEEMSFEELRAKSRGWLYRDWAAESKQRISEASPIREMEKEISAITPIKEALEVLQPVPPKPEEQCDSNMQLETTIAVDIGQEARAGRPRKTKIREVKGETQTSKIGKYLTEMELTVRSHDKP